MSTQIQLERKDEAGVETAEGVVEIRPDLAYRRLVMVNVIFFGFPGSKDWVLVDAGVMGSASAIRDAAAVRFGKENPPSAIVLTHGHFDHIGALQALLEDWDVPVYAHPLEHPYLDGSRSYPPADPWVGGGLMALLSPLYPTDPIDVTPHLRVLPDDGTLPGMPGWRWIHTPGHAPGHVSLWREEDSTIIAGDAVITTGQESAYDVAVQSPQMHGPPRYFTPDWQEAWASARKLAALEPELLVTGDGHAMAGANMRSALHQLADNFDRIAFPADMRTTR